MVSSLLMAETAQVAQNTTESTASPTEVTNHTHNSKDKETKNNYEDENGGEIGDDDGYDYIASPENLGLGSLSRHVEASIISLSCTTYKTAPHPPEIDINLNGAAFQSTKIGDVMCVTDLIKRRTITFRKDLCEQSYDSDGDIGPYFDVVLYEEDIE